MAITSILNHHNKFESTIENIIRYAQEIIADLPYEKDIPQLEKEMLLEALLLRACALWENFIEKEIILVIKLDTSKLVCEVGLPGTNELSIDLIRAIIFSDHYRDFNSIDSLIGFSRKMTVEKYNPFIKITSTQKKKITFTYKMRNYLSHYSEFSKRTLINEYKKPPYNYKRFVEPGLFLLKKKGSHFEDLVNNFGMISLCMKKIFK